MADTDTHSRLGATVLLGAGAGLRSFAIPAVLGAQGRGVFPGPARFIAFGAAVGELIADKAPATGSRWALRGLSLRLGFSTSAGYELDGVDGAVAAGLTALAVARVGSAARASLAEDRPTNLRAAVAEDALAYALVILGSRVSA